MEKQEIKYKLTDEEIASRIKSHSRQQQQIPKNKVIESKKDKEKKDRKSWRKNLQEIVKESLNSPFF